MPDRINLDEKPPPRADDARPQQQFLFPDILGKAISAYCEFAWGKGTADVRDIDCM
jgi:hypothetical protein